MMNKKKSLTAYTKSTLTVSISLALFLLGLVVFLFISVDTLSKNIKENLPIDIVLKNNIKKKEIHHLQKILDNSFFSKSTNYISKEKAIKQLAIELRQNSEDFLEFNPLPDLIVVHLKSQYNNFYSLKTIKTYLNKYSNYIKTVKFREKTLQIVNNTIVKLNLIFLVIGVILSFISLMSINNSICLKIHSEQSIIYTMQLVGAKKWFIFNSFIKSNLVFGTISSILSCTALYFLIRYITNVFLDLKMVLSINYLLIIFGYVFTFGVFISSINTCFIIRKYVNNYK